MKALKILGDGKSIVIDIPKPVPLPGQVLIEIQISAICGSERGYYLGEGELDDVPGHEFCGVIIEICQTKHLKLGDRVSAKVTQGCGECYYCLTEVPHLCDMEKIYNGGHAQYAVLPEDCCVKLPDWIDFTDGVLIGGDTLGLAFRSVSKIPYSVGRRVLVTGAGPVGLGVILMLKYYGWHVSVSEPSEARRNFAVSVCGADKGLDPNKDDVKAYCFDTSQGIGMDVAIECSGIPIAQTLTLESVKRQGTVVYCGANNSLSILPYQQIIHREVTLTGAFYYTATDFHHLCRLHQQGLDPSKLVSKRFTFKDAPKAFEWFFKGYGVGKILIDWV